MIADLLQSRGPLSKGEIYSFKVTPVLGGELSADNVEASDIDVHFSLSGQLHRQIRDLPEGAKIEDIELDYGRD